MNPPPFFLLVCNTHRYPNPNPNSKLEGKVEEEDGRMRFGRQGDAFSVLCQHSGPCRFANLLHLAAVDSNFPSSTHYPTRLPRVMADLCILFIAGVADGDSLPATPEHRIIVSHHLPLRATPNIVAPFGWSFSYEPGTLILQLHSGLPIGAEVLNVGTLYGLPNGLDPAHHDAIAAHLHREFCCVLVLLPPNLHARFYHSFCKHYVWSLLHYLLPLSPSSLGSLCFHGSTR